MTDVNDNIPEWSMVPAPYLAVVSPDAPAGSLVYKLFAQDGDEGNNGEVEYFLSDGRSEGWRQCSHTGDGTVTEKRFSRKVESPK